MYASSTVIISAVLALVRVAVATPPACLIAAMGVQTNPADLKSLCGTLETAVVGNITEKCSGDAEQSAMSIYSATCLSSASVTISVASSTSSSKLSSSGSAKLTNSSSSAKATGSISATASGSGTATAKATGSTTATATGTAAISNASGTTTGSPIIVSQTGSGAGSNTPQIALAFIAAGLAGQYLL